MGYIYILLLFNKIMHKITPEILQKKIATLNEYYYPDTRCTLFLLPDGRMYGTSKLFDHKHMLETLLKEKIDNDGMVTDILKKNNISTVVTYDNLLSIYLVGYPTNTQRKILREIVDYGHYDRFNFDCAIDGKDHNLIHKLRLILHLPVSIPPS